MSMHFRSLTLVCAALGGAAAASPLAAQAPTPAPPSQAPAGAPVPGTPAQYAAGGAIAQYLVDHPRVLGLTPKQVDQARKLARFSDSVNAPLRAQWQQITGGRAPRQMPPEERRRLAPQIRPILEQLGANDAAAFDSVDAILSPAQQQRLGELRAEYRERLRERAANRARRP